MINILNMDYVTLYSMMQRFWGVLFFVVCIVQPPTFLGGIYVYFLRKKRWYLTVFAIIMCAFFFWGFVAAGLRYENFLIAFLEEMGIIGIFELYPERLLGGFTPIRVALSSGFLAFLATMGVEYLEPIDQAIIRQEQLEAEKQMIKVARLPEVDPRVKEHAAIIATTGTGKSTLLRQDHIAPALMRKEPLIIVSGKAGREEKYGLLQSTKKLCKKFGRKLTIISMDSNIKERKLYNPFKRMGIIQMVDTLNAMSHFSEEHYESAFRTWSMTILELMQIGQIPFSLDVFLYFYRWDDFETRLRKIAKDKNIEREKIDYFLAAKEYADIAQGSYSRLKELCNQDGIINYKGTDIIGELKKGNVIFFDLDAEQYEKYTQQIGAMILYDIRNTVAKLKIPDNRRCKVILDELGAFVTEGIDVLYTQARSKNYQIISAIQDTTKIERRFPGLTDTILANSNILICGRLVGADAALIAEKYIGTYSSVDTTRKAEFGGLDGSETGSKRSVNKFRVSPDTLRNLENLVFVYINRARGGKIYKAKLDPTKDFVRPQKASSKAKK